MRSTRLDEKQPNPGSKSRTEVNPGKSKKYGADVFFLFDSHRRVAQKIGLPFIKTVQEAYYMQLSCWWALIVDFGLIYM